MRVIRVAVLVLVLGLLGAACRDGEDRPGMVTGGGTGSGTHTGSASGTAAPAFAEGDATAVIDVTMEDHRFAGIPATVKGPKLFFKANNKGPSNHELEVIDADGRRVGEIHALQPGQSGSLAVELGPGAFTLQCLVETDGKPHAQWGMQSKLTVE